MTKAFQQGWLDSLCGVYSIVNAHAILHNAPEEDSQKLFNEIIQYLSKKRVLKNTIVDGLGHNWMVKIMNDVIGDRIPIKESNKKYIYTISEWWDTALAHVNSGDKRTMIVSFDGKMEHYTVASSITDKSLLIVDSNLNKPPFKAIKKGSCKVKGYKKSDKYIIFPAQCWFLGL